MNIVTPKQMNEIDKEAISMGIPSIVLMENAASGVVSNLPQHANSYLVFCGKGNNGGDGYAIARQLFILGKQVTIISMGEPKTHDTIINYEIAKNIGIPFCEYNDDLDCDIIIDAIFGTGLSKPVKGHYENAINWINNSGKKVYSVDIPSGVEGLTGKALGVCVHADVTVTFCLPKIGLYYSDYVGKLIIEHISIPQKVIDKQKFYINLTTPKWVKENIPIRNKLSHKGDYGKVLAVAGSIGMTGAATLCCNAALRTGSGIVWLAIPKSLNNILENKLTEAMTIPVEEQDGAISNSAISQIMPYTKKADVLLFGCGISTKSGAFEVLKEVLKAISIPMVIDADGLNLLAKDISALQLNCGCKVLTPHTVEFARLSGFSVDEIENDRINIARDFAKNHNVILVLKGPSTVIVSPQGDCFINPTGNAGMATGGSGDVLAGMIASLIGQGLQPFKAAVVGVYIHGLCGDLGIKVGSLYSLLPTDLIVQIPNAFNLIQGHNKIASQHL